MTEEISIYKQMKDVIDSFEGPGIAPEGGFYFECLDPPFFIEGGSDGVYLFHELPEENTEETKEQLLRVLREIPNSMDKAYVLLCDILQEKRALQILDDLTILAQNKRPELSARDIFMFAYGLMTESPHPEEVKIGLGLMSLFSDIPEEVKDVIRTLSLSSEFTYYGAKLMSSKWESGNQDLFEVAKRVHEWGRVHAITFLEPTTDAIKEWLLLEGASDTVLSNYSIIECYKKADVMTRLQGELSSEELQGVTSIIIELLRNEPAFGIYDIDDAELLFLAYLKKVQTAEATTDIKRAVKGILFHAEKEKMAAVIELCTELLKNMVNITINENDPIMGDEFSFDEEDITDDCVVEEDPNYA